MDSNCKLYLERAQNELDLSRILFQISTRQNLQENVFKVERTQSFFSAVIQHAYFCIFYSAKAYLEKKGIHVQAPEEHRKTYEAFKQLVEEGTIDVELLKLYEEVLIRADTLIGIFRIEKKKRRDFTYQQLSQANREPAEESVKNAENFFKHLHNLCE